MAHMGGRDRWVGNKVLGEENGYLRQRADAVFVIPALKFSQHLGCDLSLEVFRCGDERALRDLKICDKSRCHGERWSSHKCCI